MDWAVTSRMYWYREIFAVTRMNGSRLPMTGRRLCKMTKLARGINDLQPPWLQQPAQLGLFLQAQDDLISPSFFSAIRASCSIDGIFEVADRLQLPQWVAMRDQQPL